VAVELATAYVSLVPSARGISSAINRELSGPTTRAASSAGASASKAFGGTFSKGMKVIGGAVGGFFAFKAVTRGIGSLIGAAEESIKIGKQTSAVLKSTGGAANVSAGGVSKLADALSLKSGVDDEVIQSGENVLLTFTRVRNEVGKGNDIFNRASGAALDMSVALGQDLQSSTIQVGKALNDPIKGLTALRRVGVAFTAQQEEQIKTLVESGDTLGAQKIILRELNTEFGGSAAAQATATSKLKVAFGNIAEQIGGVLLPYVNQFSDWMLREGIPLIQTKLVPQIAKLAHWISTELAPAIRDEWLPAAKQIGTVIKTTVLPVLERLGDGFLDSSGALQTAVVGMGAGVKLFGVQTAAAVAKVVARWAWMGVQVLLHAAKVALGWLIAMGPIGLVIAAVAGAAAAIVKHWDKIQRFVTTAARAVVDFLKRNWPLILGILTGPIGLAVLAIVKHWDKIKGAFRTAGRFVLGLWKDTWNAVWGFLRNFWSGTIAPFFTAMPGRIKGWFATAGRWLLEGGKAILRGLWQGIKFIWDHTLVGWFVNRRDTIAGYFRNAIDWLLLGGKNIIRGLMKGIREIWSDVVDWFKDLPGKVWRALGIGSPPQWAIDAGKWIMRGLVKGAGMLLGDVWDFMRGLAGRFTGALKTAWEGAQVALDVVPILRGGGTGTNQAMGRQMARDLYGWTGAQWDALNALVMSESGWSNTAQNPTSTAYGIGQFLDSTWATVGETKTSNAQTQIRAMLKYIAQRYGDPASAWAFKQSHNWYGGGGVVRETGPAWLHRREVVFTPDQIRVLGAAVGHGDAGGSVGAYIANLNIMVPAGLGPLERERYGADTARGFMTELQRRQILTDARIA
jgi:hypothetical protein